MAERSKDSTPLPNHELQPEDSDNEYTSASEEEDIADPTVNKAETARVTRPLAEVDLGPSSTDANQRRTNAALTGEQIQQIPKKWLQRRKPRLGRDGKPLRPRPRKDPDPEDLARGVLVEQVLNEHGISVYEEHGQGSIPWRGSGVDEAADERMATEFQQQFLDAAAERQERQRQAQSARTKKDTATTTDGPRLGGSRCARAKMAAAQSAAAGAGTDKN